jgi:hypothetical protein
MAILIACHLGLNGHPHCHLDNGKDRHLNVLIQENPRWPPSLSSWTEWPSSSSSGQREGPAFECANPGRFRMTMLIIISDWPKCQQVYNKNDTNGYPHHHHLDNGKDRCLNVPIQGYPRWLFSSLSWTEWPSSPSPGQCWEGPRCLNVPIQGYSMWPFSSSSGGTDQNVDRSVIRIIQMAILSTITWTMGRTGI